MGLIISPLKQVVALLEIASVTTANFHLVIFFNQFKNSEYNYIWPFALNSWESDKLLLLNQFWNIYIYFYIDYLSYNN